MTRKILYFSDFDVRGSGYKHISVPLCSGLEGFGYDVKAVGLNYDGTEHAYPFSLVPAKTVQDGCALLGNIYRAFQPDVFITALDIPLQHGVLQYLQPIPNKKYIGITALENGPLTMSWAAGLLPADAMFFISELGKLEAQKSGVKKADHLKIGIDSNLWRVPTVEERLTLRKGLGVEDDEFLVLTVADNQERKNLWAAYKAVSYLKTLTDRPIKYFLVTREHSEFGYKLRDMAVTNGINENLTIFERGMPDKDLWGIYAASDVFLLTSKAEGLGLPVLEAMASGVPVVATNTGALPELLENSRGVLVEAEYEFIDVWGNSKRSMIDWKLAASEMKTISKYDLHTDINAINIPHKARKYIETERQWTPAIEQLADKIEEICNVPKAE